jgi:hypothetical protein
MSDIETIDTRLTNIESALKQLLERQTVKDWYTTEEFARIVGKAEFTIREHCRHGRIAAAKKGSGRGLTSLGGEPRRVAPIPAGGVAPYSKTELIASCCLLGHKCA